MNLKHVKLSDISGRRFSINWESVLEEFITMNTACVEIENHGYKRATTAVNACNNACKRWGHNSLKAFTRGGKAYLCTAEFYKKLEG